MLTVSVAATVHSVEVRPPRSDGDRSFISLTLLTADDVIRAWGFLDTVGVIPAKGDDVLARLTVRPGKTAGLSVQVAGLTPA